MVPFLVRGYAYARPDVYANGLQPPLGGFLVSPPIVPPIVT